MINLIPLLKEWRRQIKFWVLMTPFPTKRSESWSRANLVTYTLNFSYWDAQLVSISFVVNWWVPSSVLYISYLCLPVFLQNWVYQFQNVDKWYIRQPLWPNNISIVRNYFFYPIHLFNRNRIQHFLNCYANLLQSF